MIETIVEVEIGAPFEKAVVKDTAHLFQVELYHLPPKQGCLVFEVETLADVSRTIDDCFHAYEKVSDSSARTRADLVQTIIALAPHAQAIDEALLQSKYEGLAVSDLAIAALKANRYLEVKIPEEPETTMILKYGLSRKIIVSIRDGQEEGQTTTTYVIDPPSEAHEPLNPITIRKKRLYVGGYEVQEFSMEQELDRLVSYAVAMHTAIRTISEEYCGPQVPEIVQLAQQMKDR